MTYKPTYISIDKVIKVIEKAEKENLISPRTREILILNIYHETDPSNYKKPL